MEVKNKDKDTNYNKDNENKQDRLAIYLLGKSVPKKNTP